MTAWVTQSEGLWVLSLIFWAQTEFIGIFSSIYADRTKAGLRHSAGADRVILFRLGLPTGFQQVPTRASEVPFKQPNFELQTSGS